MCRPKPAPRCASHVKTAIKRATQNGDAVALQAAQRDYERTPEFRKQLRQKIGELRASVAEHAVAGGKGQAALLQELAAAESLLTRRTREYNKRIRAWKKSRSVAAADTSAAYPVITKIVEDSKEPVEARRIGIENLRTRGGLFGSFEKRELSAMFGVPLLKESA